MNVMRLNQRIITAEGDYFDCEIHGYAGLLACPSCVRGPSVGSRVKVSKCLYPCERDGILVHGSSPLSHVGEVKNINYGRYFGHDVAEGVVVSAVLCPHSNLAGKIIWALEVVELTDQEYDGVFKVSGLRGGVDRLP